jgi:hypothetical protein
MHVEQIDGIPAMYLGGNLDAAFAESSGLFGNGIANALGISSFNGIQLSIGNAGGALDGLTIKPVGGSFRAGFGTDNPDQMLSVNGGASKPGGGTWSNFSDIRVKKDISEFSDGLETLMKIKPVKYKYNGLGGYMEDGKEHVGIIAQDMQKIAPYTIETVRKKLRMKPNCCCITVPRSRIFLLMRSRSSKK